MKRAIPAILFFLLFATPGVDGQFISSMGLRAGISLANQTYIFTPLIIPSKPTLSSVHLQAFSWRRSGASILVSSPTLLL